MKRLTHLFLALLATIGWSSGAWAQFTWNGGSEITTEKWATKSNWTLAQGQSWGNGGPGVTGSTYAPISISGATGSVADLEGWALQLTLVNSNLTIENIRKIQWGQTNVNTISLDASTLTLSKGCSNAGNDGNALQVTMTNGSTLNFKLANNKGGGTTTVNYGTFTSASSPSTNSFNLSSTASGTGHTYNALELAATIGDAVNSTDTPTLHSKVVGKYTKTSDINVLSLTYSISGNFVESTSALTAAEECIGKYNVSRNEDNGEITLSWVTGPTTTVDTYTLADTSEQLSNIVAHNGGVAPTYVIIPEGKTLVMDGSQVDLANISGAGDVTLTTNYTLSGNKSTQVTGKLRVNHGVTLTIGGGDGQTNSIASFTSVELYGGTITLNNKNAIVNNLTVPLGATSSCINSYDQGQGNDDRWTLAGTTTLNGPLVVTSTYNARFSISKLVGNEKLTIRGTNTTNEQSTQEAVYTFSNTDEFTGAFDILNKNATVELSGVNITNAVKAKVATLTNVTIVGAERINTDGNVTINGVVANNLTSSSNGYTFVGVGSLNLQGTMDLTNGGTNQHSKLGYGSGHTINIKSDANVTCSGVMNSSTLTSNAALNVESGALLVSTGNVYATTLTNNGSIKLAPASLGNTTYIKAVDVAGSAFDITLTDEALASITAFPYTLVSATTSNAPQVLTINGEATVTAGGYNYSLAKSGNNIVMNRAQAGSSDLVTAKNLKIAAAANLTFGTLFGMTQGTDGSTTYSSYDAYCAAINAAETIEAVEAFHTEYVMPVAAKQYYIKHKSTAHNPNWFMTANESSMTAKATMTAAAVFTFENVDKSNATANIKTFNNKYVQAYVGDNQQILTNTNVVSYTIAPNSDNTHVLLFATASTSNHKYLHFNGNDKLVGWDTGDDSQWIIEEISETEYTIHITVPEGKTATVSVRGTTCTDNQKMNLLLPTEADVVASEIEGYYRTITITATDITITYEACPTYLVMSDGLSSNAVVKVYGEPVTGEQAWTAGKPVVARAATIPLSEVTAENPGPGKVFSIRVDDANKQIWVNEIQLFVPTTLEAKEYTYYIYDTQGYYPYLDGSGNIKPTKDKKTASRYIFIQEGTTDTYYIYDITQSRYVKYTEAREGSEQSAQTNSKVQYVEEKGDNCLWKFTLDGGIIPATSDLSLANSPYSWNFCGGANRGMVLNLYRLSDSNAKWTIKDTSLGSLACAVTMFSLPNTPYMHKLIPEEGTTITGVTFDDALQAAGFQWKDDRKTVGNKYIYVQGTAPAAGDYTYTVALDDGSSSTVKLHVSTRLQSPKPMMGWLTWNWFQTNIGSTILTDIATGLETKGLRAAGYNHIVIDDCWAVRGCTKENLTYDTNKFPNLPAFVADMKSKGFKVGIYSDAGSATCYQSYQAGSYLYEDAHLAKFDSWGIDMLKYDFCNNENTAQVSYKLMGDAVKRLNEKREQEGRDPFEFNACEWGRYQPWLWAADAGASSWRATADARECWQGDAGLIGVLGGIDQVRNYWMYAGVNRYNDLDMMCIGLHGLGGPSNYVPGHKQDGGKIDGFTEEQARSQMSLWCMFASPLAITADVRQTPHNYFNQQLPEELVTSADIDILTNKDAIAINQDALGQQAEYMKDLGVAHSEREVAGVDVFVKDLVGGEIALAVFNRGNVTQAAGTFSIDPAQIYMDGTKTIYTKNIWKKTFGEIAPGAKIEIPELAPYETCVLKLRTTASYDEAEVVTITDAGAATYYFPKRVSIPDGVQAKYLTAAEADPSETENDGIYALTYKRHESEIPAGSAVVLVGNPGEYEFPYVTSSTDYVASAASSNNNLLFGYAEGADNESKGNQNAGLYALAKPVGYALGFYPFVGERFKPKKAYLNATALDLGVTEGLVKGFMIFEDEDHKTTGIEDLKDEQGKLVIYDLMGRRLAAPVKGINIINGKKFIIQ